MCGSHRAGGGRQGELNVANAIVDGDVDVNISVSVELKLTSIVRVLYGMRNVVQQQSLFFERERERRQMFERLNCQSGS